MTKFPIISIITCDQVYSFLRAHHQREEEYVYQNDTHKHRRVFYYSSARLTANKIQSWFIFLRPPAEVLTYVVSTLVIIRASDQTIKSSRVC